MRKLTLLIVWMLMLAASCDDESSRTIGKIPSQDELIEANKRKVALEIQLIDEFVENSGWNMLQTNTGIRYDLFHENGGLKAKEGNVVSLDYSLYLLDGSKIKDTKLSGPISFKVGAGDVVSGLHEVVTLMSEGDSARVILPSYLAYGLTGDRNRIPPNAALFYNLSLVKLD